MSSRFLLQKPYVAATLPQPVDHSKGQYVVAEVYGGAPGAKRRKRSELAVGIDGEGVNIYDMSASRLITSYALPLHSTFTCPPVSLRNRISRSIVERRTYVSTGGSQSELTLFHEMSEGFEPTNSSTTTRKVENSPSPVVYLGTITASNSSHASGNNWDLLAVKEDGEVQCYDGESLDKKWTSPAAALSRGALTDIKDLKVEFAHLTNAYSAVQGILKGRQDLLEFFPQDVIEAEINPEILVVITKSASKAATRTLHIVRLPRRSSTFVKGLNNSVDALLTADIPGQTSTNEASFSIHVSAGILHQLCDDVLSTFDLTETLPKEQTKVKSHGAQSFLRLSNTAVMVSKSHSISVYNPKYQSKLATIQLNSSSNDCLKRKRGDKDPGSSHYSKLVAYFPKLGVAMAVINNDLVGVQVEGQQDRNGRSRPAGLLIDSLGCSAREQSRSEKDEFLSTKKAKLGLATLDSFLPGSIGLGQPWDEKVIELEDLFINGTCDDAEFDRKIEHHFGTDWAEQAHAPRINETSKANNKSKENIEITNGTKRRFSPSNVDRRWILFALGKIFSWSMDDEGKCHLSIVFYPLNTFMWLTSNGYLTVANIEAALRSGGSSVTSIPAGQLVNALVETDPDMDLLYAVVAKNYLGASELLHAIRKLMSSLGLIGENPGTKHGLLPNGNDVDIEDQVARLQEEAEADLELAEYQLGPGSGTRGAALSLALSRLHSCPSDDITIALRTIFTSQDIVCLIYLLRFELARGGWTTRYTDIDEVVIIDEEAEIQDNAIILIASLLNNCIDAIGTVGWLSGEARLVDCDLFEAEELIASLKLEVSAALEGIEEALYLKGVLSELLGYADSYQKALPSSNSIDSKKASKPPIPLAFADEKIKALPIGLKAEKEISLLKIGSGGAVYKRTARDIGFLKSQKVGRYTRERIVL
ncbi:hypothetical protein BUE80_DR005890 [Diplocarpon rosae]|nr:hypothetical protein BUE80_DR005890 [Diplocarpon rosae]